MKMALSKTSKGCFIAAGIGVGISLVFLIVMILILGASGGVRVENNSVLVLSVSGTHPDYYPKDPFAEVLGIPEPMSFSSLLTQLRKAKVDDRIKGVIIELGTNDLGWARANELREAIKEFRTSKKPIYSYMEVGMNQEYFIATATERIFIPPGGDLFVNGLAANATFYKGSLDKLGIEAEVIQIGRYKNAPDQYTRKSMSVEQREVVNAIVDQYFDAMVDAISESREVDRESVKALIDDAPYMSWDAKERKLIDVVGHKTVLHDEMKLAIGQDSSEGLVMISGDDYEKVSPESLKLNQGQNIAVIYASGTINTGASSEDLLMGSMVGSDTIVKAIESAADDDTVRAIVLRVDSPGGSALASDLIWQAVEYAKSKEKPVVVSMADVAASGGYYIAANADKILADKNTVTGSIGVFLGKPVVKGMYDWLGISTEYVLRGRNAGLFRETEKWTPSEREKMQGMANRIYYDGFLPKVMAGRAFEKEEADALGQGRVWTGLQAKEKGLVDELGGLERAIAVAKELAKISASEEVSRIEYPRRKTFLEEIFGTASPEVFHKAEKSAKSELFEVMPLDMRKALITARYFENMRNGEAMFVMPFSLEVR
jgi:protease-4